MSYHRDAPPLRFVRFTGAGPNAMPSDAAAVVGICTVGTSATLRYAGGPGVVAHVTSALIPNYYFQTPLPVNGHDGSTNRLIESVGVGVDYTIVYIPKDSAL